MVFSADDEDAVFAVFFGFEHGVIGPGEEGVEGGGIPGEAGQSAGYGQGTRGVGAQAFVIVGVDGSAKALAEGEGGEGMA